MNFKQLSRLVFPKSQIPTRGETRAEAESLIRRITLNVCCGLVAVTSSGISASEFDGSASRTFFSPLTLDTGSKAWGITGKDWQRYQELMKGEAALYYAHLEPAHVLGLYADSESDRQRYAKILSDRESQRIDRLFAFNRAWARVRLSDRGEPFDDALIKEYTDLIKSTASGLSPDLLSSTASNSRAIRASAFPKRVLIGVRLNCAECDSAVSKLIQADRPVDIVITNASNAQIRQWASKLEIPFSKVISGQITLNRDDAGRFSSQQRFPVMYEDGQR